MKGSEALPPHSPEAERGLLCCLLLGADLAELRHAGLHSGLFYDLACRRVFDALCSVLARGGSPDAAAVQAILLNDREFPGSGLYLSQLMQEATSAANWPYWLEILRDKGQRRAVISAAARLQELALDQSSDPAVVFSDAENALQSFRRLFDESSLPEIVSATALLSESMPMPPELVSGVLHRGSKLILGGSSKSYKTWTLTDLAVSVATGAPWLGFETTPGKVLYVNLEIQTPFFRRRIADILTAKRVELNGNLDLWNLRGFAADYKVLLPKIRERIKDAGHSLLIIDPTYKLLGTADENSATDISALLNSVEELSTTTGAAVAAAAHFAKGNASGKEAIDRISGSGVFARDPDSLLVFTKHEQEGAFAVEMVLRNLPPVQPFVVRWECPLFVREASLDPAKLKQVGGRPKLYSVEKLISVLNGRKLNSQNWLKRASSETGISKTRFYSLLEQAKNFPGLHQTPAGQWFYDDKGKQAA